jgi:hypothetical protein
LLSLEIEITTPVQEAVDNEAIATSTPLENAIEVTKSNDKCLIFDI